MPVQVIRIVYEVDDSALKRADKNIAGIANKFDTAEDEVRRMNKELEKTEKATKKGKDGVSGIGGAVKKLGPLVAAAFSINAVKNFAKESVKASKEFETALASLSAITGATGDDLDFLRNRALDLAKSSGIVGKDVLKAFELAGSAKPELLANGEALAGVTEKAILLSQASGLELPTAIDALTNSLNQFGAPAEEAARFVDVLAAGAQFGASAIPNTAAALQGFGTVAAKANISIEQSVGAIETLAEKGIQGAEAGVKLRNVLTILQSGADDTNPAVVGLNQALTNLEAKNLSTAEAAKLFGKQNLVAATTLIDNRQRVEQLTDAVGKSGVALQQATINNDTLEKAERRREAAVNALLVSIGDGLNPLLKQGNDLLAEAANRSGELSDEVGELGEIFDSLFGVLESVFGELGGGVEDIDIIGESFKVLGSIIRAFVLGPISLARDALKEFFGIDIFQEIGLLEDQVDVWADYSTEIAAFGRATGASEQELRQFATTLTDFNREGKTQEEIARELGQRFARWKAEAAAAQQPTAELGEAIAKTAEKAGPAAGSIDFLEKRVSDLTKELQALPEGSEAALLMLEKLRRAQDDLAKATFRTEGRFESLTRVQGKSTKGLFSEVSAGAQRTFDDVFQRSEDFVQNTGDTVNTTGGFWNDYGEQVEAAAFSALDNAAQFQDVFLQKQLSNLQRQQEAELKATEGNQAAQQAIREKFEKQAGELQKKNAKIRVVIESAVAAIKAFATLGPVGGAIALAPLAVATAAQIALIDSQTFAKGGYTGDGLGYRDQTGERVAGTVHAREFVFDKHKTAEWKPIFDKIHAGHLKPWHLLGSTPGNSESFDDNRLYKQLVIANRNLAKQPSRPVRYGRGA